MMDQHSLLCCAAILLLFFASPIGSSSLIANANISTSWINNPSRSDTPFLSVNFKPILSTGNRFSCGFYCDNMHPNTACLLAVVIYTEMSTRSTMSYSFPELVWSANRNHPVKRNATLQLTRDGDLVLADADGTFVWSKNTSGKSVSSLDLTDLGNLVLFDRNNVTVWQSFDHPTDCLVLGQTLVRGRKLIANISPSNWSEGLYSLLATRRQLRAYIETNTPLTYYEGPKDSPKYENGSFSRFIFPFVLGPRFMRLESDGHLKVYEYRRYDWKVVADDLLTESNGECGYPMMCGKYGICSKGECVGCPDEANSKERNFRHISYMQPNLGCSPVTPISCDQSQYHTLLELQNTSYFGFIPPNCDYYRNETTWHEEAEVEDCKKSCLSNCSCKAVLSVAAAYNSKPGCLLLFEAFSFVTDPSFGTNTYNAGRSTLFLKVQKPLISTERKLRYKIIILGSILVALFGVFPWVSYRIFIFLNKKHSEEDVEISLVQVFGLPTRFSYEDLKSMTSNFINKLGGRRLWVGISRDIN